MHTVVYYASTYGLQLPSADITLASMPIPLACPMATAWISLATSVPAQQMRSCETAGVTVLIKSLHRSIHAGICIPLRVWSLAQVTLLVHNSLQAAAAPAAAAASPRCCHHDNVVRQGRRPLQDICRGQGQVLLLCQRCKKPTGWAAASSVAATLITSGRVCSPPCFCSSRSLDWRARSVICSKVTSHVKLPFAGLVGVLLLKTPCCKLQSTQQPFH